MIINGAQYAEDLYETIKTEVAQLARVPRFHIITCNPNFETRKYLALKERRSHALGIETTVIDLPASSTTDDVIAHITKACEIADGIIVQLPLPLHIDRDKVMASIPSAYDADVLNSQTTDKLSPVVGAFSLILERSNISPAEKFVTIIGSGKLVGLPAYRWFIAMGAHVSVVTKDVTDIRDYTRNADIIVCGAGVPGLVVPDMVKEGVVILDAGTSEEAGELRGDADPSCAEKAALFTPVPGGVGPLTVAILLKNVLQCARSKETMV